MKNVYVDQPLSYQNKEKKKLYKLMKAQYGLRKAQRAWYSKIDSFFVNGNLTNVLNIRNDEVMFENSKNSMKNKFVMKDLEKIRYFLGVEVKKLEYGTFIPQLKFANEILTRFGMENINKVCNLIVPRNKLLRDEGGKVVDSTKYRGYLFYK